MKRFRNASLIPIFALLVMMVAVQGCPPGNGNGTNEEVVEPPEPCLEVEKDADAYPIIIKVVEGAAITEEPEAPTDPNVPDVSASGSDGRPNTIQWHNDSDVEVEIQFNDHVTWVNLPPGAYSYVHRINDNIETTLHIEYQIVATDASVPPGTPDVDIGP